MSEKHEIWDDRSVRIEAIRWALVTSKQGEPAVDVILRAQDYEDYVQNFPGIEEPA